MAAPIQVRCDMCGAAPGKPCAPVGATLPPGQIDAFRRGEDFHRMRRARAGQGTPHSPAGPPPETAP